MSREPEAETTRDSTLKVSSLDLTAAVVNGR